MKKLLFTLMAVVMCIGLMGGAFAWFTDVEYSTGNTMSAGTLDIQIADNNEGFGNSPVSHSFDSPAGLAPGAVFTTNPVYVKNVGTTSIRWIWARFCNLVESEGTNTDAENAATPATDISNYLELVSVFESDNGGASYVETVFTAPLADAFLGYWNSRGAGFSLDGSISLNNLVSARNYGSGDKVTSIVLLNDTVYFNNPALPPGATAAFKFKFKLLEVTPNAYQGDTATFEVDFIGSARDSYPDDLLMDYITEALGP